MATGTGRLPVALLGDPRFQSRVVGLDISPGMLGKAGGRLAHYGSRSVLLASRNTGEWGRAGAVCPPGRFADQLRSAGFERVEIMPWWERFDLVWAAKQPARHDQE